jgi:WD40 repeat protein
MLVMAEERPFALVESLVSDQRRRWQQGERIFAETWLEQNPALRADPSLVLEIIYNEILLREEDGESPQLEEYLHRFPALAQLLGSLFEIHREFERHHFPVPAVWTPPMGEVIAPTWPKVEGYEIEGKLGVGGMGIIYRARQIRADRRVALKMIRTGETGTPQARARFRDEARKLARLSHPNIVPIYEVGEENGEPFFSMELVEGGSLTARLQGAPLPPGSAAGLVETIARAMHFVHQAGLIHRDLKPANILLAGPPDAPVEQCVPKVTDFGLARFLDGGGVSTASGVLPGTPSYMAPEQINGSFEEVGPLADVYGLGAILYELLTGRPPFRGTSVMDTLQQVRSRDPVPPRTLQPAVPRDLQTICLTCLRKQPRRRYTSALSLADDLQRFREGRPIRARPTGPAERLWRWCLRNPPVALLLAAVTLSLVGGMATTFWFQVQAVREKAKAEQEAERAQREAEQAQRERDLSHRHWYGAEINLAQQDWREGNPERMQERLRRLANSPLLDLEWYYLDRLGRFEPLILCPPDKNRSGADRIGVAFSPDGRYVALPGNGGKITVWNSVTGAVTWRVGSRTTLAVAFSPKLAGRYLLAAACNDKTVRVWDPSTNEEVYTITGHRGYVLALAFSPDGTLLASAGGDNTVKVWHLEQRKELASLAHADKVLSVAFSPDGQRIATGSVNGRVRVREIRGERGGRERTLAVHTGAVWSVAFSPDGQHVASAGGDWVVRIQELAADKVPRILRGHTGEVTGVAFSPDGRLLVSGSADRTVRVWGWREATEPVLLRGHTGPVSGVAFGPEGRRVASTSGWDQTVRVQDTTLSPEALVLGPELRSVNSVALSPNGSYLAAASTNPETQVTTGARSPATVTVWEAATGSRLLTLDGHSRVAFSPDSKVLAAAGKGATVTLWSVPGGEVIRTLTLAGEPGGFTDLAFSPNGKTLAAGGGDVRRGKVLLWDVTTGREVLRMDGNRGRVLGLAFSPDGRLLAASFGGNEGVVKVQDVETGEIVHTFAVGRANVNCLTFNHDGQHLAQASTDRKVKIVEVATEKEVLTLEWPHLDVRCLAYSPTGRRLAMGDAEGTVKLWDPVLGRELLSLRGHQGAVTSVAFSADGLCLASAGRDRTIRLRDATPLSQPLREQRETVGLVRFLFGSGLDKEQVLERIRGDVTISEAVRQRALDLAGRYHQASRDRPKGER